MSRRINIETSPQTPAISKFFSSSSSSLSTSTSPSIVIMDSSSIEEEHNSVNTTSVKALWRVGIKAKGSSWRSKAVNLIGQDMLVLGAVKNNPAAQLYICDAETLQWSGVNLNGEGPDEAPFYFSVSTEHSDKLFVFWPNQEQGCPAIVTHSYESADYLKLSVKKGQRITVNRDDLKEDHNWIQATTSDERSGYVPVSCIEFLSDANYHTRLELSVLNFMADMQWSTMTCTGEELPQAREFFTCSRRGSQIFLFGGRDDVGELHDEMFVLDTNSFVWEACDCSGVVPRARYAHSATVISSNQIAIFGGLNSSGKYMSDMFIFNTDTYEWTEVIPSGTIPRPRAFHTLTKFKDHLVLFGGRNSSHVFDDIHIFNLATRQWILLESEGEVPSGRFLHFADCLENSIMFFGGQDKSTQLFDIYFLSLESTTIENEVEEEEEDEEPEVEEEEEEVEERVSRTPVKSPGLLDKSTQSESSFESTITELLTNQMTPRIVDSRSPLIEIGTQTPKRDTASPDTPTRSTTPGRSTTPKRNSRPTTPVRSTPRRELSYAESFELKNAMRKETPKKGTTPSKKLLTQSETPPKIQVMQPVDQPLIHSIHHPVQQTVEHVVQTAQPVKSPTPQVKKPSRPTSNPTRKRQDSILNNEQRLKDELQKIYTFYCSYGDRMNLDYLSAAKVKMFVRDIRLFQQGLKQEELDLIYLKVLQTSKNSSVKKEKFPPSTTTNKKVSVTNLKMSFSAFYMMLKSLATRIYPDMPPAKSFNQLLAVDVLPHAKRIADEFSDLNMQHEDVVSAFEKYRKNLQKLFTVYASLDSYGSKKRPGSCMSRHEVFTFTTDFALTPKLISKKDVYRIFRSTVGEDASAEISYSQFEECLAKCALAAYSKHPYNKKYPTLSHKLQAIFDRMDVRDFVLVRKKLERLGRSMFCLKPTNISPRNNVSAGGENYEDEEEFSP